MITIGDHRVVNPDVFRVLNVNPVSVRALRGRFNGEGLDPDVLAAIEAEMELGAVLDFESLNR